MGVLKRMPQQVRRWRQFNGERPPAVPLRATGSILSACGHGNLPGHANLPIGSPFLQAWMSAGAGIKVKTASHTLALLAVLLFSAADSFAADTPAPAPHFQGVYFNPLVKPDTPDFPWLLFYPQFRDQVRTDLRELVTTTNTNLVDIFVCIAYSLKTPAKAPGADQPLEEWANLAYLDNVAAFVDDCHDAGLSAELDLVSNMWVPYSVDPKNQIGNSGYWPKPDETPWNESAMWYREMISAIETRTRHPESIALWCMMGNYELGTAEPCLWERDDNPAILSSTEQFVKKVWPVFRAAGKRPKAPPIMLPIFSNNAYWTARSPEQRLSAFTNLKKWIVDDLAMPPDYWVMTTYPLCDPAPDGFSYLRRVIEILGPENAPRIISTDLKGPGHDDVRDCIISTEGRSGPELLQWHFDKCREYGFAGWWIWAYQDTPTSHSGIRDVGEKWKQELVDSIKKQGAGRVPARKE